MHLTYACAYMTAHSPGLVMYLIKKGVRFMVFTATFNSISAISWRSVLLVDETGVHGEHHRPVASHLQTLSHSGVSSTPRPTWSGFKLTYA